MTKRRRKKNKVKTEQLSKTVSIRRYNASTKDLNKLVSHGQKVGGISISDLKRRGMPKWMDGVMEQVEREERSKLAKRKKRGT